MPRDDHACRRGHVVRRHVVHDARSARWHRLLSDEVSDMTRSSVTLSWLAPTPNDGAAIVACVVGRPEHLSPTWTQPPLTLAATGVTVTVRIRPDEGSPLRSPPPSTSRRTQQRRRGRRSVARLISDRALGPTAVDHLRQTCDSPFTA